MLKYASLFKTYETKSFQNFITARCIEIKKKKKKKILFSNLCVSDALSLLETDMTGRKRKIP